MPEWPTLQEKLLKNSGTVGKWVVDYIQYVIPDYRIQGKNSSDLLPLLFPFSHQNYARYLTQHHVKLTNLSITNSQAFSELETFGLGASPSVN